MNKQKAQKLSLDLFQIAEATDTFLANTVYDDAPTFPNPYEDTLPVEFIDYIVKEDDTWETLQTHFHLTQEDLKQVKNPDGTPVDLTQKPPSGKLIKLPLKLQAETTELETPKKSDSKEDKASEAFPNYDPVQLPTEKKHPIPLGYTEYFKLRDLQTNYPSLDQLNSMIPSPNRLPQDKDVRKFYRLYDDPREGTSFTDFMYGLGPILESINADKEIGTLLGNVWNKHTEWYRHNPRLLALALVGHAITLGGAGTGIYFGMNSANNLKEDPPEPETVDPNDPLGILPKEPEPEPEEKGRGDYAFDFLGNIFDGSVAFPLSQTQPLAGNIYGQPYSHTHKLAPTFSQNSMSGGGLAYQWTLGKHKRLGFEGRSLLDQYKYKESELYHIPELDKYYDLFTLREMSKKGAITPEMEVNQVYGSLASNWMMGTQKANKREAANSSLAGDLPFLKNGFYGPATSEFTVSPSIFAANHRPSGKLGLKGGLNLSVKVLDDKGSFISFLAGGAFSQNVVQEAATLELTKQKEALFLDHLVFNGLFGLSGKKKIGTQHELSGSISGEFKQLLSGSNYGELSKLSGGIKWKSDLENGTKFSLVGKLDFNAWGGDEKLKGQLKAALSTKPSIFEIDLKIGKEVELTIHVKSLIDYKKPSGSPKDLFKPQQ